MATDDELAVFAQRVTYVTAEVAAARQECEWSHLADIAGLDPQPFANRAYGRLEAMDVRDLALAVVVLFNDDARQQAMRSWSQLRTVEAEDAR
jgi:hypothetical protein